MRIHWKKLIERGLRWTAAAILLSGVAGCGGAKIYPVEGRVVYSDSTPAADLARYKVEFESIDGKIDGRNVSAEGEIQKDATFRITTLKPNDGALLGSHRVIIAPPHTEGDTPTRPFIIDPRYVSYETSGLKVHIEAKTNEITLTIERRKPPASQKK
jgi:hypothetical protein